MRSTFAALLGLAVAATPAGADVPKMKFNEVKEVAPGVFFRYSAISATDKRVAFGGSNNVWVVFDDFVVVIDANFPKEAGDVIAAVKKTTTKPIRYVFDTHHHGDHAWGNAVYAKEGASVIAHANCAKLMRLTGPKDFAEAGRGPTGRKDVAASTLKVPNVLFDSKLVLDDGTQRVEFLHLGHGHTAGDAVAYLPKHKVLCTGDACVNGAFNYMGQSDSASWVRALEKMQELDVKLVCPGHGPLADKGLLGKQKRYFAELRAEVKKGVDAGKELDEVRKGLKLPWYKEWTGVEPAAANVQHVYDELTGRVAPWDFEEDFGIYAGPSPTKDTPGWTKPKRVVVPSGLMPARLAELKRVAPEVEFVPAKSAEDATKVVGDADGVLGFAGADLLKAGKKLRWVQLGPGPVGKEVLAAAKEKGVVLTGVQRVHAPQVADQTFALLLALTRKVGGKADKSPRLELRGKTMLVVGLGGAGTQIARRAHAFGMRVIALDDAATKPDFVFRLEKPAKLLDQLPLADVVVLARPLTEDAKGMIGAKQLKAMKKTAYLINAAHTPLVDLEALAAAVKEKRVAGAGLDLTDVGEKAGAALAKLPGVVVTAHAGGPTPEGRERQWRLYRENVRRFAAGEPLLGVVDAGRGY